MFVEGLLHNVNIRKKTVVDSVRTAPDGAVLTGPAMFVNLPHYATTFCEVQGSYYVAAQIFWINTVIPD